MSTHPIALFAFRRPDHTREVLLSLARNREASQSDVFAFVDGPRNSEEEVLVAATLRSIHAFAKGSFRSLTVQSRSCNAGLAGSVIQGLSSVLSEHPAVISLEDDTVVSPQFLGYMNSALDAYRDDPRVWSISGYRPRLRLPTRYRDEVVFAARASSWGYGTWADRWLEVDWSDAYTQRMASDHGFRTGLSRAGWDMPRLLDLQASGEIDSWAIRWCARAVDLGALTAYPPVTLVHNIGLDGSGTHSPIVAADNKPFEPLPPVKFDAPSLHNAVGRAFRGDQLPLRKLARSHLVRWTRQLMHHE